MGNRDRGRAGGAREPIGCSGWAETGRYIGTISRWHVATCRTDCNLRASVVNALHARTYTYVHPLISRIPWIHRDPWPLGLTWLKMVDVAWRDSGYVSAVLHPFQPGWKLIWITDRIAESSRFESNSIKIKGEHRWIILSSTRSLGISGLNETKIHRDIVELFWKIKGDRSFRCRILCSRMREGTIWDAVFELWGIRFSKMEFLGY